MAKLISKSALANTILALNWQGHVELPTQDVEWLASEIHSILSGDNRGRCENCNQYDEIIIVTPIGRICARCIDHLNSEATQIRQDLEKS